MRVGRASLFRAAMLSVAATPMIVVPDRGTAAPPAYDAPGSLCARGEEVIFHCGIGRKMVSVCGDRRGGPHAQYRFGTPGDIELAFPGPGQSGLTFAREIYSGGGALQLRFSNAGHDYAVYSRTVRTGFRGRNNPRFADGIMIRRGGRLVANLSCTTEVRSDTGPEDFMPEGALLDWPR